MTRKLPSTKRPQHACHHQQVKLLNRVIGQLEGVRRMVDDQRYCVDILVQTRAAAAALKKIELQNLKSHMDHCVAEAFDSSIPAKSSAKVNELVELMQRF